MSDGPEMDWTEFDVLARDIQQIPAYSATFLRPAFFKFSQTVRSTWMNKLQGSELLPHLPYFVDYTVTTSYQDLHFETEIGFRKDGSGNLGNISEYGTPRAAPRGYGQQSLHENEDDLDRGIDIALNDARKRAGL